MVLFLNIISCADSHIFLKTARAVAGASHNATKDSASCWRVTASLLVAMSFVGCSFTKVVSLRFARVQSMQIRKCHWEHPASGNPDWTLLGAGHGHGWYQWYPSVNRNDASCFRSEPHTVFAWQHGHDWKASKAEVVATCCRTIHEKPLAVSWQKCWEKSCKYPPREPTYPSFGKGKTPSKVTWKGLCYFQGG